MFKECPEDRYDEMLGCLPPAVMDGKGFLVGEPFDHRVCKVTGRFLPTYAAFIRHNNKFFEGPNLTAPEYRAFKVQDLPASSQSGEG